MKEITDKAIYYELVMDERIRRKAFLEAERLERRNEFIWTQWMTGIYI